MPSPHATAASHHARQLAEASPLQVVDDERERTGPGRPPVRYRYEPRAEGEEALWAATAHDMQRRLAERTRHRVGADVEVWMAPADFEQACALAQQLSDLMHGCAQRPRAAGTVHASLSVYAFELADER